MRTHCQQFAQALDRYPGALTTSQPHANFAFERLGDLGQHFGRARMQPMGIGQRHLGARPVCWHVPAQSFEHRATGCRPAQLLTTTLNQQIAQPFEHGLMRFPHAGQHEKPIERLTLMLKIRDWRDESETRTLHRLLAAQPPEAVPQRQRLSKRQTGIEAGLHALRTLEQLHTLPSQLVEIIRRDTQRDQLAIKRQRLRRALQQVDDRLWSVSFLQPLAQIALTQCPGQQLQQAQVLVGARRDADGEIHQLAVAPIDAGRKMQQPHAGDEHLITGFRRAMGDRDALPEKRRTLRFARTQPVQITRRDQPISHQNFTQQGQRGRLVHRRLVHMDVLRIQLKHE